MKTLAVAVLSLLSGTSLEAGYNYWSSQSVPVASAPVVVGKSAVSSPAASPEPAATMVPFPASSSAETLLPTSASSPALTAYTPVPPRPAYEENCWLVNYVSVQTPRGVVGFPPGQSVRVVGANEQTGKLRVSDGTYEVEVLYNQLTNDPELAQRIGNLDDAAQTAAYAAQSREWKRDGNKRLRLAMEYADRVQTSSVAALRPPPVNVYLGGNYPYGSGGSYSTAGSTLASTPDSGSGAYCHGSSYGREHGGSHPWHDQSHSPEHSEDAKCRQQNTGGDDHH